MTQQQPPQKKYLVTRPEGAPPLKECLTAACEGNRKHGDLLYFFLDYGAFIAEHTGQNPDEVDFIRLTSLSLDKIAKGAGASKVSLSKWIPELKKLGYIIPDGYHQQYDVYFRKIQKALVNPPEKVTHPPRGVHAKNKELTFEQAPSSEELTLGYKNKLSEIKELTLGMVKVNSLISDLHSEILYLNSLLSHERACREALEAKVEALYTNRDTFINTNEEREEGNIHESSPATDPPPLSSSFDISQFETQGGVTLPPSNVGVLLPLQQGEISTTASGGTQLITPATEAEQSFSTVSHDVQVKEFSPLQTAQQSVAQNATDRDQTIPRLNKDGDVTQGNDDVCQEVPGCKEAPKAASGTFDTDSLSQFADFEERKAMLSKWERSHLDRAPSLDVQVVALDWRALSGGKISATVMLHAATLVQKNIQAGQLADCRQWLLDNDKSSYFERIPMALGHIVNGIDEWRSRASLVPKNENYGMPLAERDALIRSIESYDPDLIVLGEEENGLWYLAIPMSDSANIPLNNREDWGRVPDELLVIASTYGRAHWAKQEVETREPAYV